jgi:hypothetical protein
MGFLEAVRCTWSALKTWWEAWLGLLLFGLVWVVCWATVVLGPPATFGFFFGVRWLMDEKEVKWEYVYRMAKKYFLASWLWCLANLVVFYAGFANYVFYSQLDKVNGRLLRLLALGIGLLWTAVQCYALPYFVLLEKKSLLVAWKNGLFTLLASPLFSLSLWIVLAVLLILHLAVVPVFLAGPGLVVVLVSMAVEDRIQTFGIREREAGKGEP